MSTSCFTFSVTSHVTADSFIAYLSAFSFKNLTCCRKKYIYLFIFTLKPNPFLPSDSVLRPPSPELPLFYSPSLLLFWSLVLCPLFPHWLNSAVENSNLSCSTRYQWQPGEVVRLHLGKFAAFFYLRTHFSVSILF